MAMAKGKKNKKTSCKKQLLWWAFSATSLGARCLTAISLLAIAIKIGPVQYQANVFQSCVQEMRENGKTNFAAVSFCNGGGEED